MVLDTHARDFLCWLRAPQVRLLQARPRDRGGLSVFGSDAVWLVKAALRFTRSR